MTNDTAVVLMSGGIDSATCMAIACTEFQEIIPVHVQYGQQTDELELKQARRQAAHLGERFDVQTQNLRVIDYQPVFRHFAQGVANDEKDFDHLTEDDGRSAGYVPMRNLHLIATASAIADVEDAEAVFHGAQGGDEADYPDCRREFMDKAAAAISNSVPEDQYINLRIPLIHLDKHEVIREANTLGVDFHYTYSCYKETDVEHPEPCGECPACEERIEAFDKAGLNDPFEVEV